MSAFCLRCGRNIALMQAHPSDPKNCSCWSPIPSDEEEPPIAQWVVSPTRRGGER